MEDLLNISPVLMVGLIGGGVGVALSVVMLTIDGIKACFKWASKGSPIKRLANSRYDNLIAAVLIVLSGGAAVAGTLREMSYDPYCTPVVAVKPAKRARRREYDMKGAGSSFSKSTVVTAQ
ncbi:MAG: hypothetical protein EOP56_09170 [Sphingobacteriales bacterium]|nr:MAG: hypothetical protein EOP56_09170 [Sphingobacteriales bacterium]